MNSNNKALVLLSGGPDSATALFWTMRKNYEVETLTLDIGIPTSQMELSKAFQLSKRMCIPWKTVDFSQVLSVFSGNHDIGNAHNDLPLGSTILFSFAFTYAFSKGISTVVHGSHLQDELKSKEYSRKYRKGFSELIGSLIPYKISIIAPLENLTKSEVLSLGYSLGVPLSDTWSCKMSITDFHCGNCDGCKSRIEAFKISGIPDLTSYTTSEGEQLDIKDCYALKR